MKLLFVEWVTYWSPSYDNKSNLIVVAISKETLKSIKTNHICFIVGHLNHNLFQHDNNKVDDLLDTMSNECFCSLINKLTRVTDTSAIILENAWTNFYFGDIKTGVLLHPVRPLKRYHSNKIKLKTTKSKFLFWQTSKI